MKYFMLSDSRAFRNFSCTLALLTTVGATSLAAANAPMRSAAQDFLNKGNVRYVMIAEKRVKGASIRTIACKEGFLKKDMVVNPKFPESAILENRLDDNGNQVANEISLDIFSGKNARLSITNHYSSVENRNSDERWDGIMNTFAPTDAGFRDQLVYSDSWSPDGDRKFSDIQYWAYIILNPTSQTCAKAN